MAIDATSMDQVDGTGADVDLFLQGLEVPVAWNADDGAYDRMGISHLAWTTFWQQLRSWSLKV